MTSPLKVALVFGAVVAMTASTTAWAGGAATVCANSFAEQIPNARNFDLIIPIGGPKAQVIAPTVSDVVLCNRTAAEGLYALKGRKMWVAGESCVALYGVEGLETVTSDGGQWQGCAFVRASRVAQLSER